MGEQVTASETPKPASYNPCHDAAPSVEGRPIGDDDVPIRAFAFGGGAFDTVMQLGVVHALLVAQARAPDVVVGASAGAIHAVALAEVLQAGEEEEAAAREQKPPMSEADIFRRRQEARVRRFRQIFDAALTAPEKVLYAVKPDINQVQAQRPLEPLQLPIHDRQEWLGRHKALQSRAGFINLVNELLRCHISIGTITKAIRRFLGVRAAFEIRSPLHKWFSIMGQIARSWLLLGANLFRIAPLVNILATPLISRQVPDARGATAAELIFQSRFWGRVGRGVVVALSFILIATVWASISLFVLGLLGLVAFLVVGALAFARTQQWIPFNPWWLARAATIVFASLTTLGGALLFAQRKSWFALRVLFTESLSLYLLAAVSALGMWVVWGAGGLLARTSWASGRIKWPKAGDVSHVLRVAPTQVMWTVAITVVVLVLTIVLVRVRKRHKSYLRRLLEQFDLADSLFPTHALRQILVELFDPQYYGVLQMDDVVERALRDETKPTEQASAGKTIGYYSDPQRDPPIEVGFTVADVQTGKLELLGKHVRMIDGLLAATAMTPLFPPQLIDGKVYIDSRNIANEPTRPLLDLLRKRANPGSTVVQLYSVASLPFSEDSLPSKLRCNTLVEVTRRALQLQQFRDANLGRRQTEIFTRFIPSDVGARYECVKEPEDEGARSQPEKETFIRAWVNAIEPETVPDVTKQIFSSSDRNERRDLLARAVADGCRATLETIIRPALGDAGVDGNATKLCTTAVAEHLGEQSPFRSADGKGAAYTTIPGSCDHSGPGLVEICSHCKLCGGASGAHERHGPMVTLRVRNCEQMSPSWPHERMKPADKGDAQSEPVVSSKECEPPTTTSEPARYSEAWPRARDDVPGRERPLVSLLFSGGVFRGVHQMGVLNALSEIDLAPDIIAGSSVGSITAAMVAHTFLAKSPDARRERVAKLASTYLALDRLILTDRFADFIRNFTLRAAGTRFSIRQVDRFFRRYDSPSPSQFDAEARLVVAGLERLFYISPFELKDLVEAIRDQNNAEVMRIASARAVEWLDRMGIGTELLGAEPLALVITEHVLRPLLDDSTASPWTVPFDVFLDRGGIHFLATATNLSKGKLEVLGDPGEHGPDCHASLLASLLASSAFPGVFRPRQAREVEPTTDKTDQYIDGGVMDNLPLDAVVKFLYRASEARRIAARPLCRGLETPHLLFSASLETTPSRLTRTELERICNNWPALWKRARTLGYNKKLDGYTDVQRAIRVVHRQVMRDRADKKPRAPVREPLDLEVVTVRPNWLCGTFAFHPMLGFRRKRQAASIAHGCASTLLELARRRKDNEERPWLAGWGIDEEKLPTAEQAGAENPYLARKDVGTGACWFRPNAMCPFSKTELEKLKLKPRTEAELVLIHKLCGKPETHRPENGRPE